MTNSVDPDPTATMGAVGSGTDKQCGSGPIGAVRSGTTLFASTLKFVSNVRQFVAADDFSDNLDHYFVCFLASLLNVMHLIYSCIKL